MDRDDFGVLLARAYVAFVEEMRTELAEAGYANLHPSFGYVARALAEGGLTLRQLADRLQLTPQGALKIVDALEADGYLRRSADASDGRAKQLRLTKRGESALAAARLFHARFEQALSRRAGREQTAALRLVLEDIVEAREASGHDAALRPV